ncbi:MAG: DUF4280 domain-containing protein [Peptostreptococcaceae bacterium]|nr:DUF4280 domain-containing protein [Peptostreptococcaceae bacterium]
MDKKAYIVRGARMRCNCGSHPRRINLPVSHGSFINDKPVMLETDCIPDFPPNPLNNIPYFGICSSPLNQTKIPLTLAHETTKLPIVGTKCAVTIAMPWTNCKKDLLLNKMALTTDSVLYCVFGGVIKFETSGQEDED